MNAGVVEIRHRHVREGLGIDIGQKRAPVPDTLLECGDDVGDVAVDGLVGHGVCKSVESMKGESSQVVTAR